MKQIENKQINEFCIEYLMLIRIRSILHTISKNVCAWNMKKVRIPYYRIADNAKIDGML